MCTAATYQTKDFYFGRNLDYEFPYGEEVCIVPRSFPIPLRHLPTLQTHYAMIGMAHVGEVMTTSLGLGQTLIMGRDLADINQVMLVMIVIILIGMLIDKCVFSVIEKQVMRKRE